MELTKTTILLLAALCGSMIFFWSLTNWQKAVKLALVSALLEGAIRKWMLPQGQEAVYFLKDVFLAGAYVRFFFYRDAWTSSIRINAPTTLLLVVAGLVGISALNPNIGSPVLALFGVKLYLYYVPLLYIVPYLFKNEEDLKNSLSWLLIIALLICLLGAVQYAAPPSSFINTYAREHTLGDGGGTNIAVAGERARITGTFSYITGFAVFLTVFTGFSLSLILAGTARFKKINMFVILPLLAGCGLMSGSRGAVIAQVIVVFIFMGASFIYPVSEDKNAFGKVVGALLIMALITGVVFTTARGTFMERAGSSSAVVEIFDRIIFSFTNIGDGLEKGGLTGFGIGTTIPATDALRGFLGIPWPKKGVPTPESEMSQVALENGAVVFFTWYGMRLFLLWSTFQSFLRCRPGVLKGLVLTAFAFQITQITGQVVVNHTTNFFYWFLYGIALIPTRKVLAPVLKSRFATSR